MLPARSAAAESKIDLTPILEDATQPVVVTVTNPVLQRMLTDVSTHTLCPPAFIGNNLILFPMLVCYRNFYSTEIVVIDTANVKKHEWKIELYAFFKLRNNDVVTVNDTGVQIRRIKKIADCDAPCLREIALPPELMQLFTKRQPSKVRPFSIKLFPDDQHLGILYSNRDFYLVDLINGTFIKFSLGQGQTEENSHGFLPRSPHEITACVNSVWHKVTLDHTKRAATLQPLKVDEDFALAGTDWGHADYDVHTVAHFPIKQTVSGRLTTLDLLAQTEHPKLMNLGSTTSTCSFSNSAFFCYFPWSRNQALTVLSSDLLLKEQAIPLTATDGSSSRLIPCDNQAVLKWNNNDVNQTMTVCFFPGTEKQIISYLPQLPAGVARLVSGYLDFPATPCEFLTTKKAASTTIVAYSLFRPEAKAFQPDLKQINTRQDVLVALTKFKMMSANDFGNERFAFEGTMIRHFQSKVSEYLGAAQNRDIMKYIRNPALFTDPALFAEDFINYLLANLNQNCWDQHNVDQLELSHATALAHRVIKKHQLDKLAQRAQEVLVAENTATAQASVAVAAKP